MIQGFPGGSNGKETACNAEDPGSIPGSGRYPGEGNGYSLQYSFFFFFHSSILTWRIPWTKEPGGRQSMGWQRVTQLSDSHFALSLSMHDTGKRLTEQDGWVDGWMNREMSGSQTSHHSSEVSLTFCPIQLDLTVPQVFS